jgi:hypothetical protein
LLREILMGDPRLMDLVNRERRLKIRFRVAVTSEYDKLVLELNPEFFSQGTRYIQELM